MPVEYFGRVLYANGMAAPGIEVRIFDADSPGKTDDDLTITPGLSDATGQFRVFFDPARYRDFRSIQLSGPLGRLYDPDQDERSLHLPDLSDRYQPYLEFRYTVQGEAQVSKVPLGVYQDEYRLPETRSLDFVPSQHGFHFSNRFSGYPLPMTIPQLPFALEVPQGYGLCGGMSSAAADFHLVGRRHPATTQIPAAGSKMHQYLFRRQVDTFGRLGAAVVKVARWTAIADLGKRGTYQRSYEEFKKIRSHLDKSKPVLLALIYDHAKNPSELIHRIWNNHQVLAYTYSQMVDHSVVLHVYDPNFPGDDAVTIEGERIYVPDSDKSAKPGKWGFRWVQKTAGQTLRQVRGIFMMPYRPVTPPAELEHTLNPQDVG